MAEMTKTAQAITSNTRAVVLYQERDHRGRQLLTARNARGKVLFQCRRVTALRRFLMGKGYKFYEYASLGQRTREVIDLLRARFEAKQEASSPKLERPKLGDLWPKS